jgi:replicative DNA helicase
MRSVLHCEQAVIGALLLDSGTLARVRSMVPSPDTFAHQHHRLVWTAALALEALGKQIDIVTLADRLQADGCLQDVGGMAYLGELQANTPTAANAESYAAAVAQEFRRRRFAELMQDAVERLDHDDPDVVIGEMQVSLGHIEERATAETFSTLDLIDLGFDALRKRDEPLISCGLPPLDAILGGLEAGRLYVVAARTGCGKSALMLSMMHSLAEAGHPVGLCTLEMPAREVFNRLAAHRYGLNLSALTWRRGDILRDLDDAYQQAPMSALSMYVDDSSVELQGLIARGLDWHHRHRVGALFIDYLGLVQVRGSSPRHEKIGECSRAFKLLAKRLGIPVIVACQFNRESDKDERPPRLSDLRDSGSVEQDADVVIAINPLSNTDEQGKRIVQIGVLKNRSGTTGWLPGAVTFDGRTQRFIPGEDK